MLGDAALVGAEQSSQDGGAVLLGRGKSLALLTYLSVTPGNSASRDALIDLLWADLDPERARHALRQALWQLRQIIGDDRITGKDELRLAIPLESDRSAFLDAVEARELERAVSLYTGPFLPVFAAPGGAEFEHWAEVERARLQDIFLGAAGIVVQRMLSTSRFREAQQLALRIRDTSPDREVGRRLVIDTYLASGDLVHANAEADHLERLLSEEGREPEPATRSSLRAVRQADATAAEQPDRGLVAQLVGREREFATIVGAWQGLGRVERQSLHIHVSSPAGLGKTRLLNDVAARLRSLHAKLVSLRANPGERQVSFAFASHLARALCRLPGAKGVSTGSAAALVSLDPSLSATYPTAAAHASVAELGRLRVLAIGELVTAVSEDSPVAVLIDDTHWIDDDSYRLLEGLLNRSDSTRLLVVTAGRPGRPVPETSQTIPLPLAPISPSDTVAMVLSLGALPEQPWVHALIAALHQSAAGSPLVILETLQLALERGSLGLVDGVWGIPDPARLQTELEGGAPLKGRLTRLDPDSAWLLLVLARVGTPLAVADLAAVSRQSSRLEESLMVLERRGFIQRTGDVWEPAHDEIATSVVEGESPDRLRAADAAIGRLLIRHGGTSENDLIRAARFLKAAGLDAEVRLAYRRLVRLERTAGGRRSLSDLAHRLLGGDLPASELGELMRGVPFQTRLGLDRPGRTVAVAIVIAVIVAIAAKPLIAPPAPDARIDFFDLSDKSSTHAFELSLRSQDWRTEQSIHLTEGKRIDPFGSQRDSLISRALHAQRPMIEGPQGQWVFSMATGDSGIIDVFVRTKEGLTRRLTFTARDDNLGGLSPDGSQLAITTARWSPLGADRYDAAIVSTDGQLLGSIRDSVHLTTVKWSPDGTRLAFSRQLGNGLYDTCISAVDGSGRRCQAGTVLGFAGSSRLLTIVDGDSGRYLVSRGLDGEDEQVLYRGVHAAYLSPEGDWIAILATLPGSSVPAWYVARTDRPADFRRVDIGPRSPKSLVPAWRARSLADRRYADRLRVTSASPRTGIGQTFLLTAELLDSHGERMTHPVALSWVTRDSSAATVDARGVAYGRRSGAVYVVASAGGWRTDSVLVRVEGTDSRTVFQEDWRHGIDSGWIAFGKPLPKLVKGPDGTAEFMNNGDGSFPSGAASRQAWDASNGLGIEVHMSTPLTRSQWQTATIDLVANLDSLFEGRKDLVDGLDHVPVDEVSGVCTWTYPARDGKLTSAMTFGSGGFAVVVPTSLNLSSGGWYDVRIQLFADGRCALALNGEPVSIQQVPINPHQRFGVMLGSASVGTNILHGPITVWTGVRTDVDWAKLH